MTKNPDGTTTLTEADMKSLRKVVVACNRAVSSLTSDGDFLGWGNYRALGMWEDKLKGEERELTYYIDEDRGKRKTVDAWLEAYGKAKKK